ncbi:hypothetical protein BTA51_03550 [Hahella sp. CCB-MM4]|uniref:hypothetical protein n=1 Tax=Hahella sp. (strain CCB-MM4) TaxID=1926491 RepID=UPI000B9BCC22|nr:hypothetical protein [Hahella sp. CCB-MM4]OZG75460.1 hypothetical protein BTA51_03550 [Hahella sp. CCB-MM4]
MQDNHIVHIEGQRKIRNKNVQQQNLLSYLEMKVCAESFRKHPEKLPWLVELLSVERLSVLGGLLIDCSDIPEQLGTQWIGTWLTFNECFYAFEIAAERSTGRLLEIDVWERITPEISIHSKGVGKSPGFIALSLLAEYGDGPAELSEAGCLPDDE